MIESVTEKVEYCRVKEALTGSVHTWQLYAVAAVFIFEREKVIR